MYCAVSALINYIRTLNDAAAYRKEITIPVDRPTAKLQVLYHFDLPSLFGHAKP